MLDYDIWFSTKSLMRTVQEVNGIRLEQFVGQLEDGPHAGRDSATLEREAVNELIHVVEQI